MGFPRQEYWSGLPSPPAADLPDPGTEAESLAPALAGGFLTTESPGKPRPQRTSSINEGIDLHRGEETVSFTNSTVK